MPNQPLLGLRRSRRKHRNPVGFAECPYFRRPLPRLHVRALQQLRRVASSRLDGGLHRRPWHTHPILYPIPLYFEQTYPAGGYYVKDVSPLAYGGNVIYRIEYIGNGCWNTYYNYNVLTDQSCTYPASGMMVANSETGNGGTGTFSSMPRSWFGSSTPATNATMRLKGGSGWGDWSSAINTGTTQYRPYFYYSISDRYRYFTTVGSTQ